ncbi:MAG: CBS domain-containing protein [Polyangiaceae bacterium]|nr:CBS domain-containing protein [Polyangiaceae bacterium]
MRSRLAKHGLRTLPDFENADVDEELHFVADTDTPLHVAKLKEASAAIDRDGTPVEVAVRQLLRWFGVERRTEATVERIRGALTGFDLETTPDFMAVSMDAAVTLGRVPRTPDTQPETASAPGSSEQSEEPPAKMDSPGDATPRVGSLPEARIKDLVSAAPDDLLRVAVTRMMASQISHLLVFRNPRSLDGVLRWSDIAKYLALEKGTLDSRVRDVMQRNAPTVSTNDSFFDIIPEVVSSGYVVVKDGENLITGIITRAVLGQFLHDHAGPFIVLGEIERQLRMLTERGNFTRRELEAFKLEHDPREVKNVADLNLGELGRLLENPQNWGRLDLHVDRAEFMKRFHIARQTRNDLMHFDADSPSEAQRAQLVQFQMFLREVGRSEKDKGKL